VTDAIDRHEVRVWWMRTESVADPLLLGEYERLLSEDELRQRDRFLFPALRHDYLLTRTLVRTTLSRYAAISADRWRFTRGAHGRPEIADPSIAPGLCFNVSHTKGLIACLISRDRQAGVDVENVARDGRLLEIADRHFDASEVRALRSLPPEERQVRFFEYWTLKESFIKAIGVGLSFGMSRCFFDLDERPIRVRYGADVSQDSEIWRFSLHRPLPGHVLATCVRAEIGEEVEVVVRETVPLAGP
jgi:4'-phosphopantetheinyl transferase